MAAVKSNENDLSVVHYLNTIKSSSRTPFPLQFMYLLTEWEGRTGKHLARGHGVRTERSEVRAP